MNKKCSRCEQYKALTEFGKNKSRPDGLAPYCKQCRRDRAKEDYRDDPKSKDKLRQRQLRYRARNTKYIKEYLAAHPCVDCGETDPIVLEFDHVRGKKKKAICTMVQNCNTIENLNKEIDKCVVRCANCHRRKTATERGWYLIYDLPEE